MKSAETQRCSEYRLTPPSFDCAVVCVGVQLGWPVQSLWGASQSLQWAEETAQNKHVPPFSTKELQAGHLAPLAVQR